MSYILGVIILLLLPDRGVNHDLERTPRVHALIKYDNVIDIRV